MNITPRNLLFTFLFCTFSYHGLSPAATDEYKPKVYCYAPHPSLELATRVSQKASPFVVMYKLFDSTKVAKWTEKKRIIGLFELPEFNTEGLKPFANALPTLNSSNLSFPSYEPLDQVFRWYSHLPNQDANMREENLADLDILWTLAHQANNYFVRVSEQFENPEKFNTYIERLRSVMRMHETLLACHYRVACSMPYDELKKTMDYYGRQNFISAPFMDLVAGIKKVTGFQTDYEKRRPEQLTLINSSMHLYNLMREFDMYALLFIFDQLSHLVEFCQLPEIAELIEHGIEHLNTPDDTGQTLVMRAYQAGRGEVVTFLIGLGCDLNHVDNDGRTILHLAAVNKDAPLVNLLADIEDVNLDQRTTQGESALLIACREYDQTSRAKATVTSLVNNGASAGVRDEEGRVPLYWARKRQRRNSIEGMLKKDIKDMTFDEIRGADPEIIAQLANIAVFLKEPKEAGRLGIAIPRYILLYGPQGTGKTSLARALANEAGCTFEQVACSSLVERWVGAGSENLRTVFAKVRGKKPCILFLDELDAIASQCPGNTSAGVSLNQTVNQLKTLLDGFDASENDGIVVVAATNNPDGLDPAILGRFKNQFEVGLPDYDGRLELLEYYTAQLPHITIQPDCLARFAGLTDGFSGRDIFGLIESVKQLPGGQIAQLKREINRLKRRNIQPRTRGQLENKLAELTNNGEGVILTQEDFEQALTQQREGKRRRR